jgi:peptidoglycan hydrolase FlgJ
MMVMPVTSHAASAEKTQATVQHMAGMLWDQMLEAMNANGMDADTLGTGGDNFQSMFLWNLAQNDFGRYDSGLIAAATRQIGGAGAAQVPATTAPEVATPLAQILPSSALDQIEAPNAASSTAPAVAAVSGDLVSQAKSFAKTIWPQVTAAAQTLGVPAVAVLAQTALETGWGVAAPGNNLFGVKAVDGQAGSARATHEVVDGVLTPQTANFRDYGSTGEAVHDYVGLIQSGYQNATGQSTVAGFAKALQAGGYATDQNYAAKIVNIAQSPLMAQVLQAIGGSSSQANSTGGP